MISVFEDRYYLFPYSYVKGGEKVAIWGYGKIGKQYCRQIIENGYCSIKYIIDGNPEIHTTDDNVDVITPDKLSYDPNLKVVISMANPTAVENAITCLKAKGYADEDIVTAHHCVVKKYKDPDSFSGRIVRYMNRNEFTAIYGEDFLNYREEVDRLFKISRCLDLDFIRIGRHHDGGYVMMNSFEDGDRIAYSFGISDDVSWDADMADMGYHVYQYDHTINHLPYERNEFHFFKMGITDKGHKTHEDNLDTLENIIRKNGHLSYRKMVLKMDVEGAEFGVIKQTNEDILKSFQQIVIEFHNINNKNNQQLVLESLKKITEYFAVVHIHPNNYSSIFYVDNVPYPDTLEITFLNRAYYEFEDNENVYLPHELDEPCDEDCDEIILGNWEMRQRR